MRKLIIAVVVALILITANLFLGCSTVGSGNVVTEVRDFTDFTSLDIEGQSEFEIIESHSYGTTIVTDDNLVRYVTVSKKGTTLKISTIAATALSPTSLKIIITTPNLHELRLGEAARGTITGFKSSNGFNFYLFEASSLKGKIEACDTNIELSGASTVTLEGVTNNVTVSASGASKLDLAYFAINNAIITLSGESEAKMEAKEGLDVDLSGASKLYYAGNPVIGNTSISGGSVMEKVELPPRPESNCGCKKT